MIFYFGNGCDKDATSYQHILLLTLQIKLAKLGWILRETLLSFVLSFFARSGQVCKCTYTVKVEIITYLFFLSIWNAKSMSLLIKFNLNVFYCYIQVLRTTLLWLISDCAHVHQLLPVVLTIKRRICQIFHTIEIPNFFKFFLRKTRKSQHLFQKKWERRRFYFLFWGIFQFLDPNTN